MIAIVGATLAETSGIIKSMNISRQATDSLPFFYEGQLGELSIVLVLSGIGKENALKAVKKLINSYSFNTLISIGVAGAVDPVLDIGDVILAEQILSSEIHDKKLLSDKQLLNYAIGACKYFKKRYFTGKVLTVSEMITSREIKEEIFNQYGCLAIEIETYHIIHEVERLGIPFLGIRAISDKADQSIKIDFKKIKGGALQKRLYFLSHPAAYYRLYKINRDIVKASSDLSSIVGKTLARFESIMESTSHLKNADCVQG